ncbi:hypothetical protein F7725_011987 [Dissostichus mawsoni]|uniref:Uncharacterized protein n=1 Tax=Dissostichus mawsoni TaxID=36200 RepID=A0A7J5ZAP6_DISMA|nr:hypothetical protein F7725_011987 [Dissostichus mawsoni]
MDYMYNMTFEELSGDYSQERDPDNVVLCILATDDEDVKDVALQIHFTLIQAFCCENDINILRSPHSTSWKDPALTKVNRFCRESRCMDQWVPIINLPER